MFKIEFYNKKFLLARIRNISPLCEYIYDSKKRRLIKKLHRYRIVKKDYETFLYFYITKKLVFYIIYIKDVKKLTTDIINEIRIFYK